jgi:phytoene synthase
MTEQTAGSPHRPGRSDGLSPLAELVRRHDRDRFQTVLFAPVARREALFALYAFNYEIARVREAAREPMLGRIRLQWWREAIAAAYEGGPVRRHDVVEGLSAAIRAYRPDRAGFERLIDAREADLDAPPEGLAALEAYAEASSGALSRLAAELLGARDTEVLAAAGEVGTGYALAGLIRAMPFHAAGGRCYIADDAVAAVARSAAAHLAAARAQRHAVARPILAALLPAIVASGFLRRLDRAGNDPFAPHLARPDPLQSWRLLAAALRNRF